VYDKLKITGVAFGDWQNESTYSGVPKYLLGSIAKKTDFRGCVSSKQVRPWDIFQGAADFTKILMHKRPGVNPKWLWTFDALDKLSKRTEKLLCSSERCDAIMQIGTHVRLGLNGVRHYCRTDMTVAQGVRARMFSVARLNGKEIEEAINVQKAIFQSCDGIFVTSGWAKDSVCSDYGISSDNVHVIGAGASLPVGVTVGRKPKTPNILFVGRDWERKNGPLLLEAFAQVKHEVPECTLTIIGCSPLIKDDNVSVLGYLDKKNPENLKEILDAHRKASIMCVPSEFEPFGMVWLESQLYGAVPVTFEGEGRAGAIIHGKTGLLVEKRTADALAQSLIYLLHNPFQLAEMREAGRQHVLDNFTWDRVADKVLGIIQQDLSKR